MHFYANGIHIASMNQQRATLKLSQGKEKLIFDEEKSQTAKEIKGQFETVRT
jgi:hypothetical protein